MGRQRMHENVKCKAPKCDREVIALGYCPKHYFYFRKHGHVNYIGRRRYSNTMYENVNCKVSDCNRQAITKSYCRKHYSNFLRTGNPIPTQIKYGLICIVPGCDNPHRSKGYCQKHYERFRLHGDPNYLNPRYHRNKVDRDKAILTLYDAGYTLESIGKIFDTPITRERVRQIVKREREKEER